MNKTEDVSITPFLILLPGRPLRDSARSPEARIKLECAISAPERLSTWFKFFLLARRGQDFPALSPHSSIITAFILPCGS